MDLQHATQERTGGSRRGLPNLRRSSFTAFAAGLICQCLLGQESPSLRPVQLVVDPVTHLIHVTFKNQSSQEIVSFSLRAPGNGVGYTHFFPPMTQSLMPGATHEELFTQSGDSARESVDNYVVGSVLYRNGDGEGSAVELATIDDLRAGREAELARTIPVMETLSSGADGALQAGAQQCITKTAAMRTEVDQVVNRSGAFVSGMRATIGDLERECREVARIATNGNLAIARATLTHRLEQRKSMLLSVQTSRLIKRQ